jgi:hypothetical protein
LTEALEALGATVRVVRLPAGPPGPDGKPTKVGADDFLLTHTPDDLRRLIAAAVRATPPDPFRDLTTDYLVQRGNVCHKRRTREGEVIVPLCNFIAKITEELVQDDGSGEVRIRLALEGQLADHRSLPVVEVSAGEFAAMNWTLEAWGSQACVFAGLGNKDHLRTAIQLLSGRVSRRVVYQHTGWRQIGGLWCYLHAAGAIGPFGPVPRVEVSLLGELARATLPDPPCGDALVRAVRASLGLLDLGPARITVPLLGAIGRAPLGDCNVTLHLIGPTGTFKTETAALLQQHFGTGFDCQHLPGNWSSTANSTEGLAFLAKDLLLVVDDFAPGGSAFDIARANREADRLLRNVGNHAARQRMAADGSLRVPRPPRALLVSTGEDVPRGHSLQARLIIIEVGKGDIDPAKLTQCQADSAAGLYAQAMSAYLQWLACRYETFRHALPRELAAERDRLQSADSHRRSPANLAHLIVGLRCFLRFALEAGAIDPQRYAELKEQAYQAIRELGEAQLAHHQDAEVTNHFLSLLRACITSGRAHVAGVDGGKPISPGSWGWQAEGSAFHFNGEGGGRVEPVYSPRGSRVGWLDGEHLYLDPDSAYASAQRLANEKGESLAVTQRTLSKRLGEKGFLVSTEKSRNKLTVRRTLEGRRQEVLHLRARGFFSPQEPAQPAQPAQPSTQPVDSGPVPRAGPWASSGGPGENRPTKKAQSNGENGSVGRLGRFSEGERDPASSSADPAASNGAERDSAEQENPWEEV